MNHTQRLTILRTHNWHAVNSFPVPPVTLADKTTHDCVWIEGSIHRAECTAYLLIDSGIVLLHGSGREESFEEFIRTLEGKPEIVVAPVVVDRQRSLFD